MGMTGSSLTSLQGTVAFSGGDDLFLITLHFEQPAITMAKGKYLFATYNVSETTLGGWLRVCRSPFYAQ